MRDRCSLATVQIIYVPEECAGDVLISYSCRKTSLEYPDVSSILIVVQLFDGRFLNVQLVAIYNLLYRTILYAYRKHNAERKPLLDRKLGRVEEILWTREIL